MIEEDRKYLHWLEINMGDPFYAVAVFVLTKLSEHPVGGEAR